MDRFDNRETADLDFNPFELTAGTEEVLAHESAIDAGPRAAAVMRNVLITSSVPELQAPPAPQPAATVTPTRETYAELQDAYDFFNVQLFDGELPHCLITLQREKRSFGYFQDKTFVRRTGETTDEIAMNPRYFATRSIRETLSTLVHEMAHLWQFHFGEASRKGYHNKEWGDRMERAGLMPSSTGQPGGKKVGEKMSHFIIAGGPFDVACTELITQEFSLSWMDRNPSAIPLPTVQPDAAAAAGMQLPSPADIAEVEAAEKHITLPEDESAAKRRRTDGSNRVKYRCPVCATQVWGKPSLMILCGVLTCAGAKFETMTATEATPVYAPTPRPF